jgi:DHA3 family macrolide efflux protein-like MFS transporter
MKEVENQSNQERWQFRFFTIWFGQAFSVLGSHLVGFAFIWYLTEETGSATILTIGTLVQVLPMVFISPIAGALVDRWNRKMVMAVFDSITALFTLLVGILFALDNAQIWHIFLAMFIRSTCGQFQWAAMTASTSLMVPKKHLSRIAGANQTLQGAMNIIGPALGAFLIETLPIQATLFIDVITAFLAVGPLLFFKIPQPRRNGTSASQNKGEKSTFWQELGEGWRYVAAWPSLVGILILSMLINFLINPAFSLLPLVVTDHFNKGAYEYGLMNSTFGVGVIVGGLILSYWGGFKNKLLTSLIALSISGIALSAIGFAPSNMYLIALAGITLFGFLNPLINGPFFAAIQAKVEPEIQGRVLSLITAAASLAQPLGLAIAGPVADATNNQVWFLFGGILTTIAGIACLLFFPSLLEFGSDIEKDEILPTEGEKNMSLASETKASLDTGYSKSE